ncbi:Asp-tRNA(Asn)/Glu-tRNA(Gln) amidotransferase GatCAB subunit C [Nitrincola tibetensis]|uniref:Aspartyl/glutamyl-tRNA(Asn/Gln) amidotransferase subunit C n=1 Tax=Nitrincola tibetensis TaxID=2219697 RepID=A0A364NS17_9GAMM|nr:Asp-tRNA(Asn)/Glu-tRNA(Gln) amidotransferase subunit GatC [Nitrincola tibetensis]RAU19675.1 Asp-tRNA(Asn)/Glu-tRNA(Gln) amidotransferase GatCAB subunit C [Nitrincola tibetensis]
MSLDKSDIERIAHLARLDISEQEVPEYAKSISSILNLIDQMQATDTAGVLPLAHPLDAVQRLRKDEVSESNQRECLQQNAPAIEDGLFLVPRVIE